MHYKRHHCKDIGDFPEIHDRDIIIVLLLEKNNIDLARASVHTPSDVKRGTMDRRWYLRNQLSFLGKAAVFTPGRHMYIC